VRLCSTTIQVQQEAVAPTKGNMSVDPSTHFTRSTIHPLTHRPTNPLTLGRMHPCTQPTAHSATHSPLLAHPSIITSICPPIHTSTHSHTMSPIHSSAHPPTCAHPRSPTCPLTLSSSAKATRAWTRFGKREKKRKRRGLRQRSHFNHAL
jgi:hypothetical protein